MNYWQDGILKIAYWIYDFQTLIAGAVAILLAIYSVKAFQKIELSKVRNEHFIAKSLVVGKAEELYGYSDDCLKILVLGLIDWRKKAKKIGNEGFVSDSVFELDEIPKYPTSAAENVAKLLPGLNPKDRIELMDLFAQLQLAHARINSLSEQLLDPNHIVREESFFSAMYRIRVLIGYSEMVLKYVRDPELKILPQISESPPLGALFNSEMLYDDAFNVYFREVKWPPIKISQKIKS